MTKKYSMRNPKPLPSQEWLYDRFHYDPETGDLYWKHRPREDFATEHGMNIFNSQCAGKIAGNITGEGYREVGFSGKRYLLHRLIWTLYYGEIPAGYHIDHKNLLKDDNRIDNLRLVTNRENQFNKQKYANNTSGYKGVSYVESRGRYQASITKDGKTKFLGSGSLEHCAKLYEEAANDLHGEFANVG